MNNAIDPDREIVVSVESRVGSAEGTAPRRPVKFTVCPNSESVHIESLGEMTVRVRLARNADIAKTPDRVNWKRLGTRVGEIALVEGFKLLLTNLIRWLPVLILLLASCHIQW